MSFCLRCLVGGFICSVALAAEPSDDEKRLQKDIGGADVEHVLTFLRRQIPTESTKQDLSKLIEQMGDPNFKTRQEASRKLVEAGPVALPQLRIAATHADKEIAGRARRCITDIQGGSRADLNSIAVRQLARLRSEKSVDVLLAFLPTVSDELLHEEILQALATLGVSGKTVHPSLKKALDEPLLRPAAVQILLQSDDAEILKQLRTYLKDKNPAVRFHVAMKLLRQNDRGAIPVLIDLVADAPNGTMWQQAEEALYEAAGELAPAVETKSGNADDRKEASRHWAEWWKAKGDQVLLGRKDDHPNDTCVVTETGQNNRVFEWRPEAKSRFEITGLAQCVDARLLPGRRVLIAEQGGHRVTERSFSGTILWEQTFDEGPVSVQRLPNGNTFVATMRRVVEVTRDGQTIYSHPMDANTDISDANRLSDNRIAIVTTDGKVIFLNTGGKELKSVDLDSQGAIDSLPNGRVLVSQVATGRIVEFDAKGDKVMDLKVPGAWMGARLPDGNTLVASKTNRKMTKIDKDGKVIWEKNIDAMPHSIHWK